MRRRYIGLLLFSAGTFFLFFALYQFLSSSQSAPTPQNTSFLPNDSSLEESYALPSMNTLFIYHSPDERAEIGDDEMVLIATGDVIPARSVNSIMVGKKDFTYPFAKTADFLKDADITFINLETPLFPECVPTIEGMKFCGSDRAIEGLVFAGVDVASLANNHAGNYGSKGISGTKELLEKQGIKVTGTGEAVIIKIRDRMFGFLGFNDVGYKENGIAWSNIDTIQKEVKALREKVDFVIVEFHWGIEYTLVPSARQRELAHATVDAGADLIIGNHPHWVQGIEVYKGKFITYAHGNFVFDQMWSRETQEGVVGRYTFGKNGIKNVEFFPVIIENYAQPRFATQKEAEKILERMKISSEALAKK